MNAIYLGQRGLQSQLTSRNSSSSHALGDWVLKYQQNLYSCMMCCRGGANCIMKFDTSGYRILSIHLHSPWDDTMLGMVPWGLRAGYLADQDHLFVATGVSFQVTLLFCDIATQNLHQSCCRISDIKIHNFQALITHLLFFVSSVKSCPT